MGDSSVRPFVPDSAGTCRRIKKSWEKGRGLGEGRRKPLAPFMGFSRRFLPSPKREIHRLQLLHIGIPRAGLLKELGGAAGEGVRILDVAVKQQVESKRLWIISASCGSSGSALESFSIVRSSG